jgi:hypothetical protein
MRFSLAQSNPEQPSFCSVHKAQTRHDKDSTPALSAAKLTDFGPEHKPNEQDEAKQSVATVSKPAMK